MKKPYSLFRRIFKSHLLRAFLLFFFTLGNLFIFSMGYVFLLSAFCFLAFLFLNKKKLFFETFLSLDLFNEKLGRYRPFDAVDEKKLILLGRLPLFNTKDITLLEKQGVYAIVSIIEPFEEKTSGLAFQPFPPEHFENFGIKREHISYPDLTPLGLEEVKKGVALIKSYVGEGKKVYVHCKSGQGRSACLVAAYLLSEENSLFHGPSDVHHQVENVITYLKSKRKQIALHRQKKVLKEFLNHLSR